MKLINETSQQKLRGGFYTPEPIADFVLKWAFDGDIKKSILEPSAGDGVFLERIKQNGYSYEDITAIELDKTEANKCQNLKLSKSKIINSDFHKFCNNSKKKFDLIVGNPPYIRFQFFDKEQQLEAEKIFHKADMKYSKLTNAWVSFVVGSSLLLKNTGKIGFVVPAELLQVTYAKNLRSFLSEYFNKINIISFKKLVFPNIQQEVVLLLCEKDNSHKHLIDHLEVEDAQALKRIDISLLNTPKKEIDFHESKWTFYFLNQKEIDFLEKLKRTCRIPSIRDYANVEIGITTGANNFFTVPRDTVTKFNLQEYAKPMVGRSVQVKNPIFTRNDWLENQKSNAKSNILIFPKKVLLNKNTKAIEYILHGEEQGIHKGYKCSIRDEWQIMPSIKISDALFIRRNSLYPKLINNEFKAYTTDTMHRVFIKEKTDITALTASFYNSISFAFSEIVGRSYGGGVLELMPKEVEEILIPYKKENSKFLTEIDLMFRKNKSIDEILQYSDEVILKQGFGFSQVEINLANNIWKKLSSRRGNRK